MGPNFHVYVLSCSTRTAVGNSTESIQQAWICNNGMLVVCMLEKSVFVIDIDENLAAELLLSYYRLVVQGTGFGLIWGVY